MAPPPARRSVRLAALRDRAREARHGARAVARPRRTRRCGAAPRQPAARGAAVPAARCGCPLAAPRLGPRVAAATQSREPRCPLAGAVLPAHPGDPEPPRIALGTRADGPRATRRGARARRAPRADAGAPGIEIGLAWGHAATSFVAAPEVLVRVHRGDGRGCEDDDPRPLPNSGPWPQARGACLLGCSPLPDLRRDRRARREPREPARRPPCRRARVHREDRRIPPEERARARGSGRPGLSSSHAPDAAGSSGLSPIPAGEILPAGGATR